MLDHYKGKQLVISSWKSVRTKFRKFSLTGEVVHPLLKNLEQVHNDRFKCFCL